MREVDEHVVPLLEPEGSGPFVGAVAEKRFRRQDVASPGLTTRNALELAQLFQRIDAHVRIRADADADCTSAHALDGQEAVAEIRLGRRTRAHARTCTRKQIELVAVRMRRVNDRCPVGEATGPVEQLDRPQPVLGEAFLDFARLLVGVDVERQLVSARVLTDSFEPVRRARSNGVGSDTDARARAELLDLLEVRVDRRPAKTVEPTARVCRVEQDDANAGFLRGVHSGERFVEAEVVKFPHGRVAGRTQLAVHVDVLATDRIGCVALGLGEHEVAPPPEVGAAGAPAQRALERVTVRIDETRQGKPFHDAGIFAFSGANYPFFMSARAVPVPLQQLPNALTVARLLLIPIFVALMLAADGGHSWPAGIVFGIAGITDQIDGFLARRWQVESQFGRIVDPLADRLMIDAAVILLFIANHMPWAGLVVILGRDVVLMLGYKAVAPQGYDLQVNLLGKAGTWLLYAGIGFLIVTHRGTHWPYWVFWAGLALALAAGAVYAATAWKEVRR